MMTRHLEIVSSDMTAKPLMNLVAGQEFDAVCDEVHGMDELVGNWMAAVMANLEVESWHKGWERSKGFSRHDKKRRELGLQMRRETRAASLLFLEAF